HLSRWREGDHLHFGAIIRDMTEKRRERDALYQLANFDNLTGLPNRNMLAARITKALAAGSEFGLLVSDLDGFADVNNTLGYGVGDSVLRTIAQRLLALAPEGSTVARTGGDEFALMIGGSDPLALADLAER